MTLVEQAAHRVALARQIGREPMRWVAAPEVMAEIAAPELHGLPVQAGSPRSEWGLDLVTAARG